MIDTKLYPLRFKPILKDKIWGGTKLGKLLDKPIGRRTACGESWEISGVEDNVSTVANGPLQGKSLVELIDYYKENLVGKRVYDRFGSKFPLLIKFLDANDDLSIQVHPDDKLAQERHNSFGKTEMWYVVDAEPGSTLISGFNKATSREEYVKLFESGELNSILNVEQVQKDDVFFLPAGRVHTIGKGLVIAEIQQTSDITYRIYDFDRVDSEGNKRELHVEEALDAIDYSYYEEYKTLYDKSASETPLVECPYFVTKRLIMEETSRRDYTGYDSCVILMCLEGEGELQYKEEKLSYRLGHTILIPNCLNEVTIHPERPSKLLEVYIP